MYIPGYIVVVYCISLSVNEYYYYYYYYYYLDIEASQRFRSRAP
jgi:hypothetical protein